MTVIEWLDCHTGSVQAITTVILVVVTIRYVILTARIAANGALQTFVGGFFQLLAQQRNIAETIKPYTLPDYPKGREALDREADGLVWALKQAFDTGPIPAGSSDVLATIDAKYMEHCQSQTADFGYYFRSLYYLLSYIANSSLTTAQQQQYADIVRSQLSTKELVLVLYNALSHVGSEGFRDLVVRYSILKGMRFPSKLVEEHARLLPSGAFGRSA